MAEDMEQAAERIRQGYEHFNRGDFDAATRFMHPEIVWQRVADVEQPLRGAEAVREFFNPDIFETQRTELHELEIVGDCLIGRATFHSKAAGSGIELSQDGYHLWRIRDGLASEFRYFLTREEAVEAATGG